MTDKKRVQAQLARFTLIAKKAMEHGFEKIPSKLRPLVNGTAGAIADESEEDGPIDGTLLDDVDTRLDNIEKAVDTMIADSIPAEVNNED